MSIQNLNPRNSELDDDRRPNSLTSVATVGRASIEPIEVVVDISGTVRHPTSMEPIRALSDEDLALQSSIALAEALADSIEKFHLEVAG